MKEIKMPIFLTCCYCGYSKLIGYVGGAYSQKEAFKIGKTEKALKAFRGVKIHMGKQHKNEVVKYILPNIEIARN